MWPFSRKSSSQIVSSRDLEQMLLQQIHSTASGISVTPETALSCPPVLAALTVLAQSVAQLPLKTYRRIDGGKEEARQHGLYRLLTESPNDYQSAYEFKQTMQFSAAQYGNAFARIVSVRGRPIELHPLYAPAVKVKRSDDMTLKYLVTEEGGSVSTFNADEILHLRDISRNGWVGISRIEHGKDTIATAIAADRFAGAFFKNGAKAKGYFSLPPGKTLRDENFKRLKEELNQAAQDPHSTPLLEDGLEFKPASQNAKESQLLELQNFCVVQVARLFGLPPHTIQSLDDAKWANIEHQGRAFITYSLMPWLKMWEQAINRTLISSSERGEYFVEFNVDAFLRGDSEARARFYKELWSMGVITPNDIAGLENLPKHDGGNDYYFPLNFGIVGQQNDQ